jgi:acetyl esterase/lipase
MNSLLLKNGTPSARRRGWLAPAAGALTLALGACAYEAGEEGAAEEEPQLASTDQALELPEFPCANRWDPATGGTRPANSITDDEFYAWNPSVDNAKLNVANGMPIRCQYVGAGTDSKVGYEIYRVLYKTTTEVTNGGVKTQLALPATGQVYVPNTTPPEGVTRPVLSNPHGLSGLLKKCGQSHRLFIDSIKGMKDLTTRLPHALITVPDYIGQSLDHGYRLPDAGRTTYFGNQPIFSNVTHSFVSIQGEGRAIVDLVRASRRIKNAKTGNAPRWLVAGQSQGGHAALAAAQVVTERYDTEMKLLGAIAGAPATEIDQPYWWDPLVKKTVFTLMTAAATMENRDILASSLLNEEAMFVFSQTHNKECFNVASIGSAFAHMFSPDSDVFRPGVNPFTRPDTLAILTANSPARKKLSVPIFVGQVNGDPFITPSRTDNFVTKARAVQNNVTYCRYGALNGNTWDFTKRAENHNSFGRIFPNDWSKEPAEACTGANGQALPRFDASGKRVDNPVLTWLDGVLAATP